MDIGSISTTINAVKDVMYQVSLLKSLTDDIEKATEIQEAKQKALDLTNTIISLQSAVMTMQLNYMSLQEENQALRQEKSKKLDYQLVEYPTKMPSPLMLYKFVGEGTLHYICPHCFEKDKNAITLQEHTIKISSQWDKPKRKIFFKCNCCNTEYITSLAYLE
ncbi:hypothetical protein ACLRAI_07720 [[Pasteurella] aerogenes]